MKKLVALTFLSVFAISTIAAVTSASADPHKQRFQQRCSTSSNSCR